MARTAKGKTKPDASTASDSQDSERSIARPTEEEIAVRAYHIYLERGGADVNPVEDWLRAERELTEGKSRESDN